MDELHHKDTVANEPAAVVGAKGQVEVKVAYWISSNIVRAILDFSLLLPL